MKIALSFQKSRFACFWQVYIFLLFLSFFSGYSPLFSNIVINPKNKMECYYVGTPETGLLFIDYSLVKQRLETGYYDSARRLLLYYLHFHYEILDEISKKYHLSDEKVNKLKSEIKAIVTDAALTQN